MKSQQREALIEAITEARKSAQLARDRKAPASKLPDVLDGTDSSRKTENGRSTLKYSEEQSVEIQ